MHRKFWGTQFWSTQFWGHRGFGPTRFGAGGAGEVFQVRAELVATVLSVEVAEGDEVLAGDTLVLLESMKMEIPVLAEVAGRVAQLAVEAGDVVREGDLLAVVS
jgi:acetyl-CoA carboxylase biotin carboxyl carrier protein